MKPLRILFIKLTSLGDLIHALPALTDAYYAYPDIEFDWISDVNFQEIATWHPAVRKVFTTNHRKWKEALKKPKTYKAIYQFIRTLRQEEYDLIIDGQGNFKSAGLSLCAKGIRAGYDKNSVREKIASIAYQKKYAVSKKGHAVERLRQLFALSLNYDLPMTPPDCLIDQNKFKQPLFYLPSNYVMFITNASWKTKLWPEDHWAKLIKKTVNEGYSVLLPWGSKEEEERAKRLAINTQVKVLPRLSLSEIGYVTARATACVSVDTGLSHLAAALNVPSVSLYGATNSGLTGASGDNQIHLQSTLSCAPCYKKQCLFPSQTLNPPCLGEIQPDEIFRHLEQIFEKDRIITLS